MPKSAELRAQAAALKTAEAKAQPATPALIAGTEAAPIPAAATAATVPATEVPTGDPNKPEPGPTAAVAASKDADEAEDADDEDEADDEEEGDED